MCVAVCVCSCVCVWLRVWLWLWQWQWQCVSMCVCVCVLWLWLWLWLWQCVSMCVCVCVHGADGLRCCVAAGSKLPLPLASNWLIPAQRQPLQALVRVLVRAQVLVPGQLRRVRQAFRRMRTAMMAARTVTMGEHQGPAVQGSASTKWSMVDSNASAHQESPTNKTPLCCLQLLVACSSHDLARLGFGSG